MVQSSNDYVSEALQTFVINLPETMTAEQLGTVFAVIMDCFVSDQSKREEIFDAVLEAMENADDERDMDLLADTASAVNDANQFLAKLSGKAK